MKKVLLRNLVAVIIIAGFIGLISCSGDVNSNYIPDNEQEVEDIFDTRSENEKDSLIDPFGG